MPSLHLKPISELSYLTAQNVGRYRLIMHYFYQQHQRMRQWLRPEDVFTAIEATALFPDYTVELCQQDLDRLVNWKNLIPRHDGGRSASVEEYLRKKFKYQLTPYSIEIERLLGRLQDIRGYGGSLEPSVLDNMYRILEQIKAEATFSAGQARQLWQQLQEEFQKLVQNSSSYLAALNSAQAEELMLTEAFLAFKDSLTIYLQDFIHGLQRSGVRIQGLLAQLPPANLTGFFQAVVVDGRRRPSLDEQLAEEEEFRLLEDRWQDLRRWFIGTASDDSDLVFLEQATKDTIARLVRSAVRIQDRRRSGVSRRQELDYLGQWFFNCADIDDAHRLAAYAFGLYRTRHFQGYDDKDTDNPAVSMWEVGPNFRQLNSRRRRRARTGSPEPIRSRQKHLAAARVQYLNRHQARQSLLTTFIQRRTVTLSKLEHLDPALRQQLLDWIGQCLLNPRRRTLTPEGVRIKLHFPADRERTVLLAADGDLELPDFTLEFTRADKALLVAGAGETL
jgi:uncharacterized protein (TIGR02677 family)